MGDKEGESGEKLRLRTIRSKKEGEKSGEVTVGFLAFKPEKFLEQQKPCCYPSPCISGT